MSVEDGVSEAEHLEHLERQRAAALATIERVKAVIKAERLYVPIERLGSLERAYRQGRRDATAAFRAAVEGKP